MCVCNALHCFGFFLSKFFGIDFSNKWYSLTKSFTKSIEEKSVCFFSASFSFCSLNVNDMDVLKIFAYQMLSANYYYESRWFPFKRTHNILYNSEKTHTHTQPTMDNICKATYSIKMFDSCTSSTRERKHELHEFDTQFASLVLACSFKSAKTGY